MTTRVTLPLFHPRIHPIVTSQQQTSARPVSGRNGEDSTLGHAGVEPFYLSESC
ncbi:hypothetical protein M441DRAFT_54200 [Trichoderma asperellum CBS 433.97]|uniref:Uncharacterized protein n=1 Tax=Trichoderma asperellum (strain ATCC 204424 / CBS 433.97 / NBRC 101777) TaxID=1042311 RepID=A0A2T3ZJY5_TRIA4|nr:hypothetical protein M441DRAFT_54200 [Trichoderma asperellum CBS 433.97]PTB45115.1 hypothetical protein M441DRAFT_54200 [Trichoderma asperellum CBS 433.97]